MPPRYYVEFPFDRIVNVHWKKGDGDGGEPPAEPMHITCGAWTRSMYAENPSLPASGFDYWVLYPGGIAMTGDPLHPYTYYDGALYGHGIDFTTGHDPNKPAGYFPLVEPPIYLWTNPRGGWTVTYHYTGGGTTPVRVGVWRGYSLHTLAKAIYTIPPTEIGPAALVDVSMNILPNPVDPLHPFPNPVDPQRINDFPLIFGLIAGGGTTADWGHGMGLFTHSIPEMVQAHCCLDADGAPKPPPCLEETAGAPPPPPWTEEPQVPPYQYEFRVPHYPYPVP